MDDKNNMLQDLPPEAREFLQKHMHKADKYINNPIISSLLKSSGVNIEDIKKVINSPNNSTTIISNEKQNKKNVINNPKERPPQPGTANIKSPKKTPQPTVSKAYRPTDIQKQANTSTNTTDIRSIIGILALAGVIIWLLHEFTDII